MTNTTENNTNLTFQSGMDSVEHNMQAAVKNDAAVWQCVHQSLEVAAQFSDTELMQMLTHICMVSFDFRAANSASLSRFIAHFSDNAKVAVSAKNRSVRITRRDAGKPVTFAPSGDWASFKPAKKQKDAKTLTDAVATLLVNRVKSDMDSLEDIQKLNFDAIVGMVEKQLKSEADKKAAKAQKKAA